MTPLRVAYVAHSVDPRRGGMELVSARLIERLASKVDLEVVAGGPLDSVPPGVRRTKVPIPDGPSLARLVAFDALGSMVLRGVRRRVDLIHTAGVVAHAKVDLVTVHLSHASVIEAQGGARPPGRGGLPGAGAALRRRLAARLERWALQPGRVRELAALSVADAAALEARFAGLPVVVVPNGADLEPYAGRPPREAGGAPLRVTVVAGDFERKGVAIAIEAIAMTSRCTLSVAGAGDLAAMRALAAARGAAGRVTLLGHVADVAPLYVASDVVLSCSAHESFGLALVEGAAAGCAVVSTDTGVGPELVGPDGTGGVLVPREPQAIAAVLDRLDADRGGCIAMGAVAAQRAQHYTWDRMASLTLEAYAALAAAR